MMGTILEERATTNNSHKPPSNKRQTTKPQWINGALTKQSKKVFKPVVPNGPLRETKIPVPASGYQPKRRSKPDQPPQVDTSSTRRHLNPKTGPQLSSLWETRERPPKQVSHSKNNKDMSHRGPGRGHCHVSQCLSHASELRSDSFRERRPSLGRANTGEDSDSASDLSDTERAPAPPTPGTPPNLNLRAEVIDPAEFQRPRGIPQQQRQPQCQFSKSYPDFLPPPFNAWSLRQLAVFLNTEGKGVPRPRPVGQLEKYLERLLKLEWHQSQTIQDETGGDEGGSRGAPRPSCCPRPHSTPSANLSTPKSILQCQRAFPLALLSSITHPMPVQQVGCACPHCHARYPHCNGSCRTYAYHHNIHPSPLVERRGRATVPKRSSSENRTQATEPAYPSRGYKPGGFNGSSHLRRMQAAGNIRNPSLSPPRLQPLRPVFTSMEAGAGPRRERNPTSGGDTLGREGREGREGRPVSQRRRAVSERRKVVSSVKQWDLKVDALAVEQAAKLKDLVSGRSTGRMRRVEFVT
ncbi:uncharacterized protein fam217bb [Alosa sapidissima]|uniref:uncharacterized protein fam217bb n=1 Tax=Alosa sapidissima TaxID=34773 RepID=UPI001C08E322|nr:uncharacterized protein fam217bb [Alosa sapidissima]